MQKTYSLVLGWWAAKWLCHIGILKYIEENNIQINEIAWTSMWAIIWSCIALWKTSNEIIEIMKNINFIKLVDLNFKKWLVSWKKVYKFLEDIFWDTQIENTKIPLKIISTDIDTWEKIVFIKWKIIDAIRASISLPMIFASFEYYNINLVDWWLKANLPVLDVDWKDIIAVSSIRDNWKMIQTKNRIWKIEFKKWFFWYNYEILKKIITILLSTNEDLTLEIAKINWKNIILLTPDTSNYEYYDFNKFNELSDIWYKEISEKLTSIKK
jgi:predicted acylesterase/phospholipase RssA